MTHFASELRQNPKMRLRSLLLRLHAGPTTPRSAESSASGSPHRSRLNAVADLLALVGAREGDASAAAVAAHLDAGVALLDACDAIAVRLDRLHRRRLLARLALHLLSSSLSRRGCPVAPLLEQNPP